MGLTLDGQDYIVQLTPEPIGGEGGKRSFIGQNEEAKNRIVVDGTLVETRQEEVLLHELLHICDTDMQEYIVSTLSTRLYGYLKSNGLLVSGIIEKCSDGMIGSAEMSRLNEQSNEIAEKAEEWGQIMPTNRLVNEAVSEEPWYGEPGRILDGKGRVNRTAVHVAARELISGRWDKDKSDIRTQAKRFLRFYKELLHEEPPIEIVRLAQR